MLLATTLAMPGSAQQYKPEYKLSAAVGPAYAWGRGAVIWAQLIKERTGGRINIRQFPGSAATAGDPLREFPALREGTVDMAVGSALNWADQVPVLNLFALPFFVPDSPALDRMLHSRRSKPPASCRWHGATMVFAPCPPRRRRFRSRNS